MSADGSKPRTDAATTAPGFEASAPELPAFVADQMLGLSAGPTDGSAEEVANRLRRWLAGKRRHADGAPRKMINHHVAMI